MKFENVFTMKLLLFFDDYSFFLFIFFFLNFPITMILHWIYAILFYIGVNCLVLRVEFFLSPPTYCLSLKPLYIFSLFNPISFIFLQSFLPSFSSCCSSRRNNQLNLCSAKAFSLLPLAGDVKMKNFLLWAPVRDLLHKTFAREPCFKI